MLINLISHLRLAFTLPKQNRLKSEIIRRQHQIRDQLLRHHRNLATIHPVHQHPRRRECHVRRQVQIRHPLLLLLLLLLQWLMQLLLKRRGKERAGGGEDDFMCRQGGDGEGAVIERGAMRGGAGEMQDDVAEKILRLEETQLSREVSDRRWRQHESNGWVDGRVEWIVF